MPSLLGICNIWVFNQLSKISHLIQFHKYSTWSPSNLLNDFTPLILLNTPFKGFKVFFILMGSTSFIENSLLEDLKHVDLLPKIGEIQIIFGILAHLFLQCPSYFLWYIFPILKFKNLFTSFDLSLFRIFEHIINPRFFYGFEGKLTYHQSSFPISLRSISFISISVVITPIALLGSWALIVSSLAIWFLFDHWFFLLQSLVHMNLNTIPFQEQLNVA